MNFINVNFKHKHKQEVPRNTKYVVPGSETSEVKFFLFNTEAEFFHLLWCTRN
jgi:hypothetical protein